MDVHGLFLLLSATRLCLIMPQATMLPTSLEASRPALALGPTPEIRRSMMGVPVQKMRYNLILPSTTTCNTPRPPPEGVEETPQQRRSPQKNKEILP
jgi:hypothetical protein